MSAIKIYLEQAEYETMVRYAESLGVSLEDVAYAALNRLMLVCNNPEVHQDIVETRNWRANNLPLGSDSACYVHTYEGKPDEEPTHSRFC